jgi:hypothetical protein
MDQIKGEHVTSLSRRVMLAGGVVTTATLLKSGASRAQAPAAGVPLVQVAGSNITLEIYKGIALDELDRWDAVIHSDVTANSPAGRSINGLKTLKQFQKAFTTAFRPRVDLIDHYVLGDRGLLTFNLHWKHDGGPFNGIAPTGKSGTSVETALLRIENGLVTRWDVADNSLDLANYLHDQGMKLPTLVEPPALIKG